MPQIILNMIILYYPIILIWSMILCTCIFSGRMISFIWILLIVWSIAFAQGPPHEGSNMYFPLHDHLYLKLKPYALLDLLYVNLIHCVVIYVNIFIYVL